MTVIPTFFVLYKPYISLKLSFLIFTFEKDINFCFESLLHLFSTLWFRFSITLLMVLPSWCRPYLSLGLLMCYTFDQENGASSILVVKATLSERSKYCKNFFLSFFTLNRWLNLHVWHLSTLFYWKTVSIWNFLHT